MQNGICPNCQSHEVYVAETEGLHAGVVDMPKIQLYKENRWIPDVDILLSKVYLCQDCGHFQFFVQKPKKLERLAETDNWAKVASK